MDRGRSSVPGRPQEVGEQLRQSGHTMFLAMPTPHADLGSRERQRPLPGHRPGGPGVAGQFRRPEGNRTAAPGTTASKGRRCGGAAGRELWFKYDKDLPDVVKGLSCPCGRGNSSLCWGATAPEDHQPQAALRPAEALSGGLEISGSVGMLPQNPQTLFVKKTVREDLYEILRAGNSPKSGRTSRSPCDGPVPAGGAAGPAPLRPLRWGEQQRAALAKVLLLNPEILLLDEPTKGLDAEFKQVFAEILQILLAAAQQC